MPFCMVCIVSKIVYDQWYKNRHKSVSFSGHLSDGLFVVSVRAASHIKDM